MKNNIKNIFPKVDFQKVKAYKTFNISNKDFFKNKNVFTILFKENEFIGKFLTFEEIEFFKLNIIAYDIFPFIDDITKDDLKIIEQDDYLNLDLSGCDLSEKKIFLILMKFIFHYLNIYMMILRIIQCQILL